MIETEHTLIDDLKNDKKQSHKLIIERVKNAENNKDVLIELAVDLSEPIELLIMSVDRCYNLYGEQVCSELINRLCGMYIFSGTKLLEKYLYEVCVNCVISSKLKMISAMSLCSFKEDHDVGYDALDNVCKNMSMEKGSIFEVPTPCQTDAICTLMRCEKYKKRSLEYFCNIINTDKLDNDFRYKTILSLENKKIKDCLYFIKESSIEFISNNKNMTMYRILAGQLLIQKCNSTGEVSIQKMTISQKNKVEGLLLSFAQDNNLDYNLRADSADVLLRIGSNKYKENARDIIILLGRENKGVQTIFNNAQNVHTEGIEESVVEILEFLSNTETMTIQPFVDEQKYIQPSVENRFHERKYITFEYVKKQIEDLLKNVKHNSSREKAKHDSIVEKINISLNRIFMDRALYSKYSCTLLHILLKVWTYISAQAGTELIDEMKKRLLEELADMSGTCSTGFASRLANVISGFGKFNIKISWRDQIIANLNGRLNARARDICITPTNKDIYCLTDNETLEDFQAKVLEEMTINSNDYASRINFHRFFIKNLSFIREELYKEFKDHITDTDFDLYMRSAISTYETGEFI